MERWEEHYSALYSRVITSLSQLSMPSAPYLLRMNYIDEEPTLQELSKAIASLVSGKAPWNDDIPPDLIKSCRDTLLLTNAGEKDQYRRTCVKPGSLPFTRTKVIGVTATTTGTSPFYALVENSLQESSWSDSKN